MLVGGGNSAGQAAVFLSGHARKVHMMIRGGGLGASMSRYLIERIEATPNIELMFNTEVVALEGTRRRLARAGALAQPPRPATSRPPTSAICSCSSAPIPPPAGSTAAASRSIAAASWSPARSREQNQGRLVSALETSVPGVFAVGDVRSGSVKRVGGAIGEGAQVVAALHGFLGDTAKPAL